MVLCFSTGTAHAHAVIESTVPASNEVLGASPPEVVLTFNEPIDDSIGWIRLFDETGERVAAFGIAHGDRESIVVADLPTLDDGGYLVVWRVVSADGHPVEGAFGFSIGTSSAPVSALVAESVVGAQGSDSWVGKALGVTRLVGYIAIALIAGALFAGGNLEGLRRRLISLPAAVAMVASIFSLALLGPYSTGTGFGDVLDGALIADTVDTRTGTMLVVRIILLAGLAIVGHLLPRRIAMTSISVIAVALAVGGHSGAQSPAALAVAFAALHAFAVWIWLGSIAVLAVTAHRQDARVRLAYFSASMNIVLPAVVVSGVLTSAKNMGGLGSVFDLDYGRLVIAKIVFLILMVIVGFGLRRRLSLQEGPIRRLLIAESVLGLFAFAVAALLVVTPPTKIASDNEVFQESLIEAGVLLDLTVDPAEVGNNEIHLLFNTPNGTLSPVSDVQVRFALPSRDVPNIFATVTEVAPNHWIGVLAVPYPGDWTLEVLARPTTTDMVRYSVLVPVGD